MAHRLTSEEIQAILARGAFEDLVGTIEDEHLECKRSPYLLNEDYQKQELAKDVSAIANMSARTGVEGGHILLGVRTEKSAEYHGDVAAETSPFEQARVDPGQHHQILEAWLLPVPEGLEIFWYPSANDATRGIVGIIVPRQRPELWPFIVTRVVEEQSGKVAGNLIGYFERRRDGVVALPAPELQRLLRDGRRFDSVTEQISALAEEVRRFQQQLQPAASAEAPRPSSALENHRQRRGEAVAVAGLNTEPVFALTAAPIQSVKLPTLFRGPDDPLVRLLEHPPELRGGGFDLHVGETPGIVRGQLRRGVILGRLLLECWHDGTLIFVAEASDFLCWGPQTEAGGALRINPLALAEATYLFAELAHRVYQHAEPRPQGVEFSLTLYRMERGGTLCGLTPGPLKSRAFQFGMDLRQAPEATAEFIEQVKGERTAGVVAYRLLVRIYTWFGFDEEDIPYMVEEGGDRVISADRIRADGGTG